MTRHNFVGTLALAAGIVSVAGLPAWAGQERTSNGNTTGSAAPRGGGESTGSATSSGSSGSSSGGGGGSVSGTSGGSSMGSSPTPSAWGGVEAPMRANDAPSRASDQGGRTRSGPAPAPRRPAGGIRPAVHVVAAPPRPVAIPREVGAMRARGMSPHRHGAPFRSTAVRGTVVRPQGKPSYAARLLRRLVAVAATSSSIRTTRYYPWGFWGPGYGFGLGYLFYDPFSYGGYGYGLGGPYGYGGYSGGGYGGGGGGYAVSQSYRDQGSLRLKIDPKQAKVYIDGAFVGEVDNFDGAFQKLSLDAGSHKVEVKADGFAATEFEVMITPGETVTFKGDLKRIQ